MWIYFPHSRLIGHNLSDFNSHVKSHLFWCLSNTREWIICESFIAWTCRLLINLITFLQALDFYGKSCCLSKFLFVKRLELQMTLVTDTVPVNNSFESEHKLYHRSVSIIQKTWWFLWVFQTQKSRNERVKITFIICWSLTCIESEKFILKRRCWTQMARFEMMNNKVLKLFETYVRVKLLTLSLM